MTVNSYLVAQVGDNVQILQPGPFFKEFGIVEREWAAKCGPRAGSESSVTARWAIVRLHDDCRVMVHADELEVATR